MTTERKQRRSPFGPYAKRNSRRRRWKALRAQLPQAEPLEALEARYAADIVPVTKIMGINKGQLANVKHFLAVAVEIERQGMQVVLIQRRNGAQMGKVAKTLSNQPPGSP